MQEKKKNLVLVGLEIVSLAIVIPIVYWAAVKLLIEPVEYYIFEEVPTWLLFLLIIGFDIAWVLLTRRWGLKNVKVKIVLALLVLTLSASVLHCLLVLGGLAALR